MAYGLGAYNRAQNLGFRVQREGVESSALGIGLRARNLGVTTARVAPSRGMDTRNQP